MSIHRRFFLSLAIGSGFCFAEESLRLEVFLDTDSPGKSFGRVSGKDGFQFPVGFGRNGVTPAGKSFRGGSTLLGRFQVNAILSGNRFEMEKDLINSSGKSESWLRANLFRNMNSIDFDGDGKGGEYGAAFIGLQPLESPAKQPFHFGFYKGTFRWYSFAIHGTQDETRIGRSVTGGCINVGAKHLAKLVERLELGDRVEVREN